MNKNIEKNIDNIAIKIENVSKTFDNNFKALDNINLQIKQGEFFALLGANGAGKTTLISALSGLIKLDSGDIFINNYSIKNDLRKAKYNIGIVPQELVFDPFFTVREILNLQSGYFGITANKNKDWINEILNGLGLSEKAETTMRKLSGGMKRRVLVAQALVHKPKIVVLDEPTAGVDVELRQSLWEFIKGYHQQGNTIILTTHYLEEAEQLCSRLALMKQGKIIAVENMQELLEKHQGKDLEQIFLNLIK